MCSTASPPIGSVPSASRSHVSATSPAREFSIGSTPAAAWPSRTWAAIASPGAAQRYGLVVLDDDISDHKENFTRFVAVSRGGLRPRDGSAKWRTALRLVTGHEPGALHDAIEPFRYHKVNMVSLHSRPIHGEPWRYQFLVDIDGHRQDEVVVRALEDVERRSALLVTLGTYPAAPR
jgi:prephenate dehydratase